MNYEEALNYIHAVQWAGHKPGLTRTRTLLAALGDPHKQLRFIHVAGTNGKGSTAAMLASCLQAAGYRVGLYTSPFINRFNERIQINGQQIPDEALVALVEQVKPAADTMEDVPTEFEIITALGMLYFAQQKCEIVVLEVGLGGTLDSTNVIDAPECAVITALGMDHVKELGPTLADIASAKAGIIKPGSPVVSYGGVPEADAVIARAAAERHAPLTVVDLSRLTIEDGDLDAVTFDFDGLNGIRLPLIGSYQPRNAATAITALRVLRSRGWNIPDSAIRAGLVAGGLLLAVYAMLGHAGALTGAAVPGLATGAEVLTVLAERLFGKAGLVLLAAIFMLACFNTCVGLIACVGEYFHTLLPRIPYPALAAFFAAASMLIANLGLAEILRLSVPVLNALYPVAILLICLSFVPELEQRHPLVYPLCIGCTAVQSIADALPLGALSALANALPLAALGFGWVLPAAAGLLAGILLSRTEK